jgi:hypothetical protein
LRREQLTLLPLGKIGFAPPRSKSRNVGHGAVRSGAARKATGFVVEDEKEAVAATHRLSRLSRSAIRQRFEERFTARRMAREYLVVYRSLIEFEALRSRVAVARASFR